MSFEPTGGPRGEERRERFLALSGGRLAAEGDLALALGGARLLGEPPAWTGTLVECLQKPRRDSELPFGSLLTGFTHEPALLRELSRLAARSLLNAFQAARAVEGCGYAQFCEELSLSEFLAEHPVLARGLATRVWRREAARAEMLARLRADLGALEAMFGRLGDLQAHEPLSEAHDGGRQVQLLRFESGELIYKPRALTLEADFWRLTSSQGLRSPLFLERDGYGWVERIVADDAPRDSEKAGLLLGLVHRLGGVDFHQENVLWSQGEPIAVDLETLLHPPLALAAACQAVERARTALESSVLGTGLLPGAPVRAFQPGARVQETSGLAGPGDEARPQPAWEAVNTDGMRYLGLRRPSAARPAYPLDAERLVAGYRKARVEQDFSAAQRRFLFRTTWLYELLQERLSHPGPLRDGAEFSLELARLYRYRGNGGPVDGLVACEEAALIEGDIPRFTTRGRSGDLHSCRGRVFPGWLRDSGADPPEPDVEAEADLIRASLYSAGPPAPEGLPDPLPEPCDFDAILAAERCAEQLERQAYRGEDGSATWISLEHHARSDRYELRPVEPGLHRGSCGIALFLAALARVTGRSRWADLALAALQPVLREDPTRLMADWGVGGTMGLGSVVYALVQVGALLERPELLERATVASRCLTGEDPAVDLTLGWAGALCGLHELLRATGEGESLARRAAARVLAGPLPTLTGMSHGLSGVAMALWRLPDFRTEALELIAQEDGHYSSERQNWPDLRYENRYDCRWCHGSAGILLARAAHPELRGSLFAAAAHELARAPVGQLDHPCCGEAGRIEALLACAEALSEPSLAEAALVRLSALHGRLEQNALRLYTDGPKALFNPSLLRGVAGIGYLFLRSRHRELPSALTLSGPASSL